MGGTTGITSAYIPGQTSAQQTSGGILTPSVLAARNNALLSPDGIGFGTVDPRQQLGSLQNAINTVENIPQNEQTPQEQAALAKAKSALQSAVQGEQQLAQQEQQFFQSTIGNDEKEQSAANSSCSNGC